MRALVLLVAALALAGCATPAPASTAPQAAGMPSLGSWTLDCAQGAFAQAINASWRQTCEARASHNPGPKEEIWIAVNPKDPDNVVLGSKDLDPAASDHCVWNGVSVTHDGGKTWKDVVIGGKLADRKPDSPFYGYACNTDPDFQFTKDGALHYGVEMYNPNGIPIPGQAPLPAPVVGSKGGYKILLATSHDGGDTWPDVIVFQPDLVVTTDYSRMIASPTTQTILEAIGSDGGGGCHVLRSTDGGKSADFRPIATKDGPPCGSGGDTTIAVSPKGVAVIVGGLTSATGAASQDGSSSRVVVRSTDDGLTWVDSNPGFPYKPVQAFSESKYRVASNFELAYDLTDGAHKGTLYVAYASADRDEADVYVRSSTDDGRTWSAPGLVNQDASGPHQWMPNLAVAGDGSVHVFFMDKRYDPAHKLIDIVHAVSFDAGKTWTDERVSTISYDGDLGVHQDGFPFIGDYLGVACVKDDCWAGFPDASDGKTTVVAAAHMHRASVNATT